MLNSDPQSWLAKLKAGPLLMISIGCPISAGRLSTSSRHLGLELGPPCVGSSLC